MKKRKRNVKSILILTSLFLLNYCINISETSRYVKVMRSKLLHMIIVSILDFRSIYYNYFFLIWRRLPTGYPSSQVFKVRGSIFCVFNANHPSSTNIRRERSFTNHLFWFCLHRGIYHQRHFVSCNSILRSPCPFPAIRWNSILRCNLNLADLFSKVHQTTRDLLFSKNHVHLIHTSHINILFTSVLKELKKEPLLSWSTVP